MVITAAMKETDVISAKEAVVETATGASAPVPHTIARPTPAPPPPATVCPAPALPALNQRVPFRPARIVPARLVPARPAPAHPASAPPQPPTAPGAGGVVTSEAMSGLNLVDMKVHALALQGVSLLWFLFCTY